VESSNQTWPAMRVEVTFIKWSNVVSFVELDDNVPPLVDYEVEDLHFSKSSVNQR
jgi:hypothetical protein